MPWIHGLILDRNLNSPTAAKVHIVDAGGRAIFPDSAIHKVGPGMEGFYTAGDFSVEAPTGFTTFIVEKGTEYKPYEVTYHVAGGSTNEFVFPLERWVDLAQCGWYSGNAHVHYNESELYPDERLRLDPHVHDLGFTAISHLQRWNLPYASNRYSLGLLMEYSDGTHAVVCGQENRHNRDDWEIGYGHILLLGIQQPVRPLSRGLLVGATTPDYPPLCQDLDGSRAQGGVNLWCHNGEGMETPVAAILGKIDVINLFDPFLFTPDQYQAWYDLLNCGIHLPCSTGSDWFICSNNRVYVHLDGQFSDGAWLSGLKAGRSFITNGPAMFLEANGSQPGERLQVHPGQELEIQARWMWYKEIEALEIIHNGRVVCREPISEDMTAGACFQKIKVDCDGWIAARAFSTRRDSFYQPIFAHTSPVWVEAGRAPDVSALSAQVILQQLDAALEWIGEAGKFAEASQKQEMMDLYQRARADYWRLAKGL